MAEMEAMVERLVPEDVAANLGAMAMLVCTMPQPIREADSLAVYPGLGELWRPQHAVEDWQHPDTKAQHLFVAGTNPKERTQPLLTLEELAKAPINLTRNEGVRTQVEADNTPHQANWLADQVEDTGVESLALYVSPYHLVRAFCTTLATFKRRGIEIPMVPVPVRVHPDTKVPEADADAVAMFYGEAKRIAAYQPKGDVATLEQLREYLSWARRQPLFANSYVS
jgi:hypothetical protein